MTETDPARRRRLLLIDNVERAVVTILFVALCWRFVGSLAEAPSNAFFLVSEGIVAVFVLLRRQTEQVSLRPFDWIVGAVGTMLPMLVLPTGGGTTTGAVLMVAGLLIALGAKLSLARSFGIVAANRGVKTRGLYAAVRHPMYLGYFLVNAGMLMANPSLWNAAVLAAWAACQLARIRSEERILFLDQVYRAHAEKVRFRLFPYVY